MIVFNNPSWPYGKWILTYIQDADVYRITTSHGLFVADVGPTLVAHWLVRTYNALVGFE